MFRLYVVALCLLFCCLACQSIERSSVFVPEALAAEYFNINTNQDTILHTSRGARIHIPAHAIAATGGSLRLAITEAYTIADMVSAGLLTVSNGEPLSSGGMINIQPADSVNAKIVQPITVEIPTEYIQEGMQLYKGERDKTGNLNWVKPDSMPMAQINKRFAAVEQLMQENCYNCHSMEKKVTGPALLHVTAYRERKWLHAIIRNAEQLIASGDPEANCLYEEYGKYTMTRFPALPDATIEEILQYIDNVSKQKDLETYNRLRLAKDSCKQYYKLKGSILAKQNKMIRANGASVTISRDFSAKAVGSTFEDDTTENKEVDFITAEQAMVPSNNYTKPAYYTFNINSFNWYNVDILMKKLAGTVDGELRVSLTGNYTDNIHIFLIIPDIRLFAEGSRLADGQKYGFFTGDGKIPLLLNKKAWIIATGEKKDQLLFAQKVFLTQKKQELVISPAISTKAAMNAFLQSLQLRDIKMEIMDTRSAKSNREIDSLLRVVESKKPKHLNCSCGETPVQQAAPGAQIFDTRK